MSEILNKKEEKISKLEEKLGKDIPNKVEKIANWCRGIGAISVGLLYTLINYTIINKIESDYTTSEKTTLTTVMILMGLVVGSFVGYHIGREEIAPNKLSKKYPDKKEEIYEWEKLTRIPV